VVFRRGDFVYWYCGEILTRAQYEARYFAHLDPTRRLWFTPYALALKDGRICDAIFVRGVLAYVNDPRDRNKCNLSLSHRPSTERPDLAPCYATRDIFDGDEIFCSYGAPWWGSFPDRSLALQDEVALRPPDRERGEEAPLCSSEDENELGDSE